MFFYGEDLTSTIHDALRSALSPDPAFFSSYSFLYLKYIPVPVFLYACTSVSRDAILYSIAVLCLLSVAVCI